MYVLSKTEENSYDLHITGRLRKLCASLVHKTQVTVQCLGLYSCIRQFPGFTIFTYSAYKKRSGSIYTGRSKRTRNRRIFTGNFNKGWTKFLKRKILF